MAGAPRFGPGPTGLQLRLMAGPDLALVEAWLRRPHVARWYLEGSSIAAEIEDLRRSIGGEEPTEVLVVEAAGRPVGWCQWYRCDDYPGFAADVGAAAGDIGIDYALGETAFVGRGLGTAVIAALVGHIRVRHPHAGIVADPQASNSASRRVLEKNGFGLLDERIVASEPVAQPMAVYRLSPVP